MRGCSVEYSDSGHCFIFFFFLHHCPLTLPPPYSQKTSLRISASRLYLNILYRSASTPSHLRTSTLLEPRTRHPATILAPHYQALLPPQNAPAPHVLRRPCRPAKAAHGGPLEPRPDRPHALLHQAYRFQRVWQDCALQRAFADGTRRGGLLECGSCM